MFRYAYTVCSACYALAYHTDLGLQKGDTASAQLFVGTETPAREFECVLLYDEDMGTFTLERLDSTVVLTHDRKVTRPAHKAPSRKQMH